MIDIAVIGAGMAGLICAQQLHQSGYRVVVVEKSRGLGGRVATRRLQETCADHGVRYLEPQGKWSRQLIDVLLDRHLLKPWIDTIHQRDRQGQIHPIDQHPRYVAPDGMTAIAKFLATGLEIWRGQRVVAIDPSQQLWQLTLETAKETADADPVVLTARAIVLAIPAPQALALLEPLTELPSDLLANLRSVEFDPCLTAIAVYPEHRQPAVGDLPWRVMTFADPKNLDWVGLDSSKRSQPTQPIFVLQSSAAFAQTHLEAADLQAVGVQLLAEAAQVIPWLDQPESLQVHRWRYAFVRTPWRSPHLTAEVPLPLVCSGDWCGGDQIEAALNSGQVAATQIDRLLDQRQIPDLQF
jgi:renalase